MPGRRVTAAILNPENPLSLSARARSRRWQRFLETFPRLDEMNVLDLGGTPEYWARAPARPTHVTTLNLHASATTEPWITSRQGDACAPPRDVLASTFDLVVSNSLIEHVGGHVQRQRLADVIHSMAKRHWIQTPYRYFPVEPHWLFPGLQFLPFAIRVGVTRTWPIGHRHITDQEAAIASVHEVDLIGAKQMKSYFPNSVLWFERFAGIPKSLVAIRAEQG